MTSRLWSGSVGHGHPKLAARRTPGSDIAPSHSSGLTGFGDTLPVNLKWRPSCSTCSPVQKLAHDLDALLEARELRARLHAEELELRREVAEGASEPQPAVGKHVDHRGVLGAPHRAPEWAE